ncbi:fap1 adhesin-like isoform X2 [Chironomus tepperi]|uniref:fap1 adhesin-like isoform X2 n=1 Tax=Chironomus tepperi TaxID=113505 RepID=UPI00391F9862
MDQNSKEKKLFFFGQPGCLKVKFDIPIRPSDNSDSQSDDNEISEQNNSEEMSENTLNDDKITTKKAENSSDDDGDELLKKIDAVLEVKNEHQNRDNSENLSNETIKETPINDASNNHIDEVSTETIQKESNNIEKQNIETSTNEESQNKCEEKSALEKAFSANTETITEKIENVYNVKSVDNNIEVNDENLAADECKPIELKSEESNLKSLESVDEKSKETADNVENLIESNKSSQNVVNICESKKVIDKMEYIAPNESSSEEKNLEKEEILLKEVEKEEIESSSEVPVDEKSPEESEEKIIESIDENKEKEVHSENFASKLPDNQTEICESSVNKEAIDPVISPSDQNNTKMESDEIKTSDQQSSSSLIAEQEEEDIQTPHIEPQDITDNVNVEKLPELQENLSSETQISDIKVTPKISEEETICEESDLKPPQEEINSSEVPNDENTCPSQEPQVLPNETSIKNVEESVPKNDNLEIKNVNIETKEETLQDDDKKLSPPQEEQLKVTDIVENIESQNQVTVPSQEVNKNENIEILETPIETQKDESLIEAENTITQIKEEDIQNEEKLSTEIEVAENSQTSSLEKETTEDKDEINPTVVDEPNSCLETKETSSIEIKANDDQAVSSEITAETESVEKSEPALQNQDIAILEQSESDQEEQQIKPDLENVTPEEESSSIKSDIEELKTFEPQSEDVKTVEPINIESSESCSNLVTDKLEESQSTEIQINETEDQSLALSEENNVQSKEPSEEDNINIQASEATTEPEAQNIENIKEETPEIADKDQHIEETCENKEQVEQDVLNLEEPQEISTALEETVEKVDINEETSVEQEQNISSMEPEECVEKENITEEIQNQNIDEISDDSGNRVDEVIEDSIKDENIQTPEAMEIENVDETESSLQVPLNSEIAESDIPTEDQTEVKPIEESKSIDEEKVMEIEDQNIDVPSKDSKGCISVEEVEKENLQIEQSSEIKFQEENDTEDQIPIQHIEESKTIDMQEVKETTSQNEEVQQNVDTLESNKEVDNNIEEVNTTEISNDDNAENIDEKGSGMPNVEGANRNTEEDTVCLQNQNKEIENSDNTDNLISEQVENEEEVLEKHQISEILKTNDTVEENISISDETTAPSVEETPICEKEEHPVENELISDKIEETPICVKENLPVENESIPDKNENTLADTDKNVESSEKKNLPVENESISNENEETILDTDKNVESSSINEDDNSLKEVTQIESDKTKEENMQLDENPKLDTDSSDEKEIESIEKSEEPAVQINENIESQYVQETLVNQNEPKDYESPTEELNPIECSASVENIEPPKEVSDKPEVLSELSKESFEHEEKLMSETQSIESQNIDESVNQNIAKVETPPSPQFLKSEDSHIPEIAISDEKEQKVLVDLKENLEKTVEINESSSSSDQIDTESKIIDELEVIPQKSITVEENSNEKINDNQVELSKIDNKSSSLEKVSPLEDINIQNDISGDLNKSKTISIEEEEIADEGTSIAQPEKDIQPQLDEKIEENLVDQNIEEKKVELETEKQYEQITERHTEDNLTDKSDDEKCKEDKKFEASNEIVVESLTEKIILNEMPVKEICPDNNRDKNEMQDDSKQLLESESKCSEIVNPPTETIAINVEIENKLEIKETAKTVDDKLYLEDSESKEILNMDILKPSEKEAVTSDQKEIVEDISIKHVELTSEICAAKIVEEKSEQPPVDPLGEVNEVSTISNVFDDLLDKEAKLESIPITKSFQKPVSTRKRKMSERKSISESDSDGGSHFVTDSVSNEKSSDEETVATKKPRIRNKIVATRNTRATRQSARVSEEAKSSPEVKAKEQKKSETEKVSETEEKNDEEKTIQNFKFDYDENEDIASKMAAIKTLICKEPTKKEEDDESNESSADESSKKKPIRKGRKSKRGRSGKKNDAQDSSSDDSKSAKIPDSKRSKTSESEETTVEKQSRKKRDSTGKGLLKYIDTSLVIETVETEAPIRQSRRIAQQKIREETERRQMEEKMLKQMKAEAEKKKKQMALIPEPPDDDNDRSSDESYKDSTKKKKTKIKPADKQWQTSSSHSENSESEDEFERPPSEDPGSPLFRSDHEFSPESDDDEAPAQPVKRARTAKKQVEESSDDEDINPIHACQVCHKTDSPEWILLCDECDHGYHCSCLKPIIFCIPSGNWYCPLCCHKKLVDDLSVQLEKLDTLIVNIKAEEIRKQKQLEIKKLTEITQENILNDKRKNRSETNAKGEKKRDSKSRGRSSNEGSGSNDDESSENSSDNEPLNEISYKLRRRNQTTTSYRFNDYDDLINSAIKRDMDEVKGMGNAGRGKDISTIIEADKEEKKLHKIDNEKESDDKDEKQDDQQEGEESSGSDIVRPKKAIQRKKKNRKLNNLDATSEEDQASDEDFKGEAPSSNSDTEEEYSISSNDVSESSLDLPLKKKAGQRSTRSAAKNRRYDETFIDDNSSDDEPLIKKRIKKQLDSDEEEFDVNEENSDGSTPEDIDSEDLCDDTESDDSSENNWPRKKKKRNASYDIKKPRKNPKKTGDGGKDKAFRAGISKKKILKVSENESEASDNESDKGRRRTRGKKLLYLIEDDYESDDGIKPGIGVVRPETPPEERELFVKKQEEIKRMLAEKNTEAARQLAVPTIEPIQFAIEKPESPVPPPLTSDELASLSTIPKNVIEGAKALDMDYNKIKPILFGSHTKATDLPSAHDMSEEDLARMMEEEDFAQHQLKMVGETINRNKLLELEVKEEAFASIGKGGKIKDEKEPEKLSTPETKKRARKPKQEKQAGELSSPPAKILQTEAKGPATQHIAQPNVPVTVPTSLPFAHEPSKPHPHNIPSVPPLISNPVSHSPYPTMPPRYPGPHHLNIQDRPSVLSNYIPRHEGMPPRLEGMRPLLEGMRPRLEGMPPRLGMQPRLEGMLSRLEGMGPRIQGMPPRLEGMGPRLEGLPPRLEGITSRLEGMTARLEAGPSQQQLRFPHQPPEGFPHKSPPIAPQLPTQLPTEEVEEKKKGRRKKYTPLRTDLVDSNASKVAKLETPTTSSVIHSTLNLSTERPDEKISLPPLQRGKPEVFNPATSSSSSVITRLLQPQQRPPFGGFTEQMNVSVTSANNPNAPTNPRAFPEDMKHLPIAKQVRPGPQAQFPENPFVPRGMHTLYRGPPTSQPSIYGIPSHHARIPYPFHLHPNNNLRPNMQEYGAPYNIPPQFGYYAPPAHSRQHPPTTTAPPISHPEHPDIPPNARPNNNANPNDEPSESSEFGGLVSYFSSQQELD